MPKFSASGGNFCKRRQELLRLEAGKEMAQEESQPLNIGD
jgi:hypothetical protein